MFYQKNVPGFERLIRVMIGLAMAVGGLFVMHGGLAGLGLAVMGATMALTGFIGFCPACATVGRRLKRQ